MHKIFIWGSAYEWMKYQNWAGNIIGAVDKFEVYPLIILNQTQCISFIIHQTWNDIVCLIDIIFALA